MKSSPAASGLCDWIINITMYYDVVVSVEPKKIAVKEAQETHREWSELQKIKTRRLDANPLEKTCLIPSSNCDANTADHNRRTTEGTWLGIFIRADELETHKEIR